MKQEFSTQWQSSTQPRKQRKFIYNAPLHLRHKFLSTHLSKELRQKYGKRNLPLRKGDEVLVMRGFFKKKKAKVTLVNLRSSLVTLEGLQRTKKDGSKVNVYFHPSNLQIMTLELADKERIASLNRKGNKATVSSEKPKEIKESKEKAEKRDTKEVKKEKKDASN